MIGQKFYPDRIGKESHFAWEVEKSKMFNLSKKFRIRVWGVKKSKFFDSAEILEFDVFSVLFTNLAVKIPKK